MPRSSLFLALCLSAMIPTLGCDDPAREGACETDQDCSSTDTCIDGFCEPLPVECYVDSDCGSGAFCRNNICDLGFGSPEPDAMPPGNTNIVGVTPGYELDFGSPIHAVGIERKVSLENLGDASFTLVSAALSPETSPEMVVTSEPSLPVTLAPGDRAEVTVTYTLVDGEEDQGTLTIETNAGSCVPECADASELTVALISEFKGGRELTITPDTWDFGYVQAGGVSAVKTLLLTNNGTIDKLLTVEQIMIAGDVGDFDFSAPSLPGYIAPGESIEVPVSYRPVATAPVHELTFTVTANSDTPTNRVLNATFRGTSQPPQALVWNPPEVIFPNLAVGASAQEQVALMNVGAMPIEVTNLVLGQGAEYSYVAFSGGAAVTFPRTVFPGDQLDVYVDYTSQTGAPSLTTMSAPNDQASGDVPVLSLRGESFIPPGGPVLDVISGPETKLDTGCACQATADVSAANVDLSYRANASGQVCAKPANPACGLGGAGCACTAMSAFGEISWGGATVEEVRGDQWIIDEVIHHEGAGSDGTFLVRTDLLDDCLAVPGSTDRAVNFNCCMWVDCETGTQACFDYGSNFPLCAQTCEYLATVATSQDCLERGPVAIRTQVKISNNDGSVVEERHFCTTHASSGVGNDIVTMVRQAGYFQVASVAPGVVEVNANQACPAP